MIEALEESAILQVTEIEQMINEYSEESDLSDLPNKVVHLCELLKKMPAISAKKIQPRVEKIHSKVADLAKIIKVKARTVEQELKHVQSLVQANKSYKRFSNGD